MHEILTFIHTSIEFDYKDIFIHVDLNLEANFEVKTGRPRNKQRSALTIL